MEKMSTKVRKAIQIHNNYFGHVFGHTRIVEAFLRATLSKKLVAELDFSTLIKKDKSFLPTKYRECRYADLLYSAKKKGGKEEFMLFHLEHQSTHDKHMAGRILGYHTPVIDSYLTKGKKFPPILSFVFYHGGGEWSSSKSILGSCSNPDFYLKECLQKAFLQDLTRMDIEELKKHGLAAVAMLVLAKQSTGAMTGMVKEVTSLFPEQEPCCKKATLDYMLNVNIGKADGFLEELRKFDSETADNYRTMFEREKKQSETKGRQLGKEEGIQLGKEQGIQLGKEEGIQLGKEEGIELGEARGRLEGRLEGRKEGRQEGRQEGKKEGIELGEARGKQEGIELGIKRGSQRLMEILVRVGIVTKKQEGEVLAQL